MTSKSIPFDIELSLRGMQHGMTQHVQTWLEDSKKQIAEIIEDCIASFDFKAEVAKLVEPILRERLRFVVNGAVNDAVASNRGLQDLVENRARKELEKALAYWREP